MSMRPKAVLFDIDGVLVDSYQAHYQSWHLLASRYGRVCTEQDFAAQFGRTTREVMEVQWHDANLTEQDYRRLDEEKEAIFRELIEDQFPVMPGALELIENLLEQQWRIGLGSSGPVENVQLAIRKLGIASQIQIAISGNDVSKGKPDPEVFLKAAQGCKTPPDSCVVIEDATHGIEAALAAGMLAVGFASQGRKRTDLAQAHLVIDSLSEISSQQLEDLLTLKP